MVCYWSFLDRKNFKFYWSEEYYSFNLETSQKEFAYRVWDQTYIFSVFIMVLMCTELWRTAYGPLKNTFWLCHNSNLEWIPNMFLYFQFNSGCKFMNCRVVSCQKKWLKISEISLVVLWKLILIILWEVGEHLWELEFQLTFQNILNEEWKSRRSGKLGTPSFCFFCGFLGHTDKFCENFFYWKISEQTFWSMASSI